MSGISTENRKTLMLFSGRAYPDLAVEIGQWLGVAPTSTDAYDFANEEIFVRYDESVRGSDAFVIQSMTVAAEQVADGIVDHGGRAQARFGQADHRRGAVLPVRAAGQEASRPRADLRAADGRPLQDRRREPDPHRRSAHRPDPGLLRRPGGSPVRDGRTGHLRCGQVQGPPDGRGGAGLRSRTRGRALDRPSRRLPARVHPQDPGPARSRTRSSRTGSSATSRAGSA